MYSLSSYHTFGLAAQCQSLVGIDSLDTVSCLFNRLGEQPVCLLGHGSNSVFVSDFAGTVLLNQLKGVEVEELSDEIRISAAAGENWHQLVSFCMQQGYYGLENLALIPGTVGAAPIQNIGAYGVELGSLVHAVEFLHLATGEVVRLSGAECQFAYRDSIFKHELANKVLISKVILSLPRKSTPVASYGELASLPSVDAMTVFNKVIEIRQQKLPDPAQLGNAGSFFKNPIITNEKLQQLQQRYPDIPAYRQSSSQVKLPAAWLIDQLGFKGQEFGGVRCHPSQALVLTNTGTATGEKLLSFARQIKHRVAEVFDLEIENEVRLIGKTGLVAL